MQIQFKKERRIRWRNPRQRSLGPSGIVPVLQRNASDGCIERTECGYHAYKVESWVWAKLNRELLKLESENCFYPLDAMDAYGTVVNEMEKAAEKWESGDMKLKKASLSTYLYSVAHSALWHFYSKKVKPERENYRRVEQRLSILDSEDNGVTVQQLAEALPAIPGYEDRRIQAQMLLEEIYEALNAKRGAIGEDCLPVKAFRAYISENCDKSRAAKKVGLSRTQFYREWSNWLVEAREAA